MPSQSSLWALALASRVVIALPHAQAPAPRDVDPWNRELEVNWDFDFQVGIGYHVVEGKISDQSPFVQSSLSLPPIIGGGQSKFQFTIMGDSSDVQNAMTISAAAGVPAEGGTIDLSTSYSESSELSDTHKAAYLMISQMDQSTVITADPQLTDEANQLLQSDPCQFDDQYGSYFVAGFVSGRYIRALADFHATSAAEMSDFTAKISYSGPSLDSDDTPGGNSSVSNDEAKSMAASVSLDMKTSSENDQITISTTADSVGLRNAPTAISIDELYNLFDSFNDPDNQLPVPNKAILRSFRSLSNQAAIPGDCGPQGTATQYAALGAVEAQIFSLNQVLAQQVTATAQDLSSQLATIAAMDPTDPAKATSLADWETQFQALKAEVTAIPEREAFMVRVSQNFEDQCAPASGYGPGCPKSYDDEDYGIASQPPYFWTWGEVADTNMGLAIRSELQAGDDIVDRDSVPWPTRSHFSASFGDPDKVIVGFEVFADWQDSDNGWWRLDALTHDSVNVQFTSDVGRDPAWRLKVWYVDASLYRFPGTY